MVRDHKLPKVMWGGFTDGKFDLDPYPSQLGGYYGTLYTSRSSAKQFYDDVRQVEVREVKRKRSK